MVHRADGEERRHRDPLGAHGAVGEDEDVGAAGERGVGLGADALDRALQPGDAFLDRPRGVDRAPLKTSDSTWRRLSSSWLRRIGFSMISCRACSGVSSSRLRSEPTSDCTLITTASRIESIGGFVTCAKSCLKYE